MDKTRFSNAFNRIRLPGRRWLSAGLVVVIITGLLCLTVLLPAGVRALPGRYAARLPGFLQDLRRRPHPDVLPTPAVAVTPFVVHTPAATPRLSGVTFVTPSPQSGGGTATTDPEAENSNTPDLTTRPIPSATVPPVKPTQRISTPTVTSSPTAAATQTLVVQPTPTALQLPARASLPPITHTYQTWNNCGPATLSMALYYFDQSGTQAEAATFLKPDPEDKNVSPYEMAAYARSLGLGAIVRVGGDLDRLRRLIAGGFPVVVETWFIPEPGDQMGHYRLLTAYDDSVRQFISQDSYNGPNVRLDYVAFDELWRVFNRVYLVVYRPSQMEELLAILGEDADDRAMYLQAIDTAQVEVTNPTTGCVAYEDCSDVTAFAWFNIGSNLTALGRHEEATAAYDQARLLGLPWRMLWYQFGPYESYFAVHRFDDVVALATATLQTTGNLEESYYWRGKAYLAQGDINRARIEFQTALKYNPGFTPAMEALESLE